MRWVFQKIWQFFYTVYRDKRETASGFLRHPTNMGLALHGKQPRQLTWAKGLELEVGNKVTFEIVEVSETSPPGKGVGDAVDRRAYAGIGEARGW